MQIITLKPLVEQFRAGTFKDEDVGPYFFAYIILETVMWAFAYGEVNPWAVVSSIAVIIITVFGILHLKTKNRGSFGNGFLNKYFALGWVITVRMLLLAIPVAVLLFGFTFAAAGEEAVAVVEAVFVVTLSALFYWWLGCAFAESQGPDLDTV